MSQVQQERFHYLDSLRGLAALAVFFSHLIGAFGLPSKLMFLQNSPVRILWHGEGAVTFFFMLSGFVLSHQLSKVDNILDTNYYFKYAFLRLNRIYPSFAIMIILSYFLRNHFYLNEAVLPSPTDWIKVIAKTPISVTSMFKELSIIINIDVGNRILPQGWSLVLEILISIIFPFLFFFTKYNKIMLFLFVYFTIKFLNLHASIMLFVCVIYL